MFNAYAGIHQPTPIYPRPGSVSSLNPPPLNVPQSLQQIQISLTALHERMSTLERTQAMLLRKGERRRGWFWPSNEADELDEMEDEAARARWMSTTTATKVKRKKHGFTFRVVWALITAVRRAMLDVGVGMMVALIGVILIGGGWRKARFTLRRLGVRMRRMIQDA